MSNLTTAAFMLIQAQSCLAIAVGKMTNTPCELEWSVELFDIAGVIGDVYNEIIDHVEAKEDIRSHMDKQINKVKKDIKTNNKKKATKDVNKLLKMDKKFDKKLDKCSKMSKKKR